MLTKMIADLPDQERPRERVLRFGADALSTRELLAILIRNGTRGKSALDLATELLQHFSGSLPRLSAAKVSEISQISGLGPAKAITLLATFALARRMRLEDHLARRKLTEPQEVACYVREKLRQDTQEEFHVLLLDSRMQLLSDELVTLGLVDRSLVHAREVFRSAIREACQAVILCHNHPSGETKPSTEDINITHALQKAGDIIGIRILDHVIFGSGKCNQAIFSFRQENLLLPENKR